jgi:hypothetical protein
MSKKNAPLRNTLSVLCCRLTSPTKEISIVSATLRLDERFPLKTLQRGKMVHKDPENGVRISNTKPCFSVLQNPKKILSERALVGGLHADLIELIYPNGNGFAEGTLEGQDIATQPVIRAQARRDQKQGFREALEKQFVQPLVNLFPSHEALYLTTGANA